LRVQARAPIEDVMKTLVSAFRLPIAACALAALAIAAVSQATARGRDDAGFDVGPIVQRLADNDDDDDRRGRGRGRGGDDARPYVPLENIIGQIQARVPGRLVGVRGPNGQGIYRIVWETPDGRVITFVVDGRTGQILR
jgi:uncharacterized membrane protein YkoI